MNKTNKRRFNYIISFLFLLSNIVSIASPVSAMQKEADTHLSSEIEFDYNDPSFTEIIDYLDLLDNYQDQSPIIRTYEIDSAYELYTNEDIHDVKGIKHAPSSVKLHLLYFQSSNSIEAVLTISAIDLIKSTTATFTTTGPMGNKTETIYGYNHIPFGLIVLNWKFYGFNYPLYPQGQYVKIYGTITGVLGNGSFGPSTSGIQVG